MEGGPNKIEKIRVKEPVRIVMASSGITQTTKEIVDDVRRLKEENPEQYERIFKEYVQVFDEGLKALQEYELNKLGGLMNKNQDLLSEMTLSCPEIEEIRKVFVESGSGR